MRSASLACLLLALALLPGCIAPDGPAWTGGTSAQAPAEGEARVLMKDDRFYPAEIWVRKGTLVTFANEDEAAHTAQTKAWRLDTPGGLAAQRVFDETGTFAYSCEYHHHMTGRVHVVA